MKTKTWVRPKKPKKKEEKDENDDALSVLEITLDDHRHLFRSLPSSSTYTVILID
jgi:hypothetical protein